MLVGWEVVPESFSLEVVRDVGDAALQSLDFELEGLLEVKEVTWCLPSACVSKCVDPDVGGL